MVEVMAAIESNRKNSTDHTAVPAILAKISGMVTNTNVVPCTDAVSPILKLHSAGKIINPIRNATKKSSIDTCTAVRVSRVSLG